MKSVKKYLSLKSMAGLIFLVFSVLLMAGCSPVEKAESEKPSETNSSGDKNAEAIQSVIEIEFNAPDEEFRRLWGAAMDAQQAIKSQEEQDIFVETPVYKSYTNYMEDTYALHFTENGYYSFINSGYAMLYSLYEGDFKMSTSDIKIDQSEDRDMLYHFTFLVKYESESGETDHYQFEGKAVVYEEGKIGEIEFVDKDGLREKVYESNNVN